MEWYFWVLIVVGILLLKFINDKIEERHQDKLKDEAQKSWDLGGAVQFIRTDILHSDA